MSSRAALFKVKHSIDVAIKSRSTCKIEKRSLSLTTNMNRAQRMEATAQIASNPYFDKYKAKLQHLQSSDPDEYEYKLQQLHERLNPTKRAAPSPSKDDGSKSSSVDGPTPTAVPPSEATQVKAGMTRSKGLDSVMKLELIQDQEPAEITKIWNQFHSKKDGVFAVLSTSEFQNLLEKAKECPVFVFPIPRDDGFEFMLCQFDRHDVYFTPLAMFQMVRENAPPCLTLQHYSDLMDSKGIVLMEGQFDEKVIKKELALNLVQQMSMFYGRDSKFYEMVKRFNYQPETFKYEELVATLKSLPQCDLK